MHQRRAGFQRFLRIDDVRQQLVLDFDKLGGVLGERARVGEHRRDPLSGVAYDAARQRPARDFGRVHPDRERIGVGAEFFAGEHVQHAGRGERGLGPDRDDARARMRRGDQRDVLHAGKRNVGDVAPAAGDEARVLLGASSCADVAVAIGAFFRSAHFALMRSAASCTASTICW